MNAPATKPPAATCELAPSELGLSLQLSRASLMALTRLQLAIQSGDRRQAMAAMDRLHALDGEMESLVGRLPPPAEHDIPSGLEWGALAKHVSDQKLALAFEKLALVSEISGPDMVTPARPSPLPAAGPGNLPPLPEWPELPPEFPSVQPSEWRPGPGVLGLVLALLLTMALAAAAVLMTAV